MGIEGDPAKIGIIGCGRLGRQLLRALKNYANVPNELIYVSTRRPEALSEFSQAGVNVDFNNTWVISQCDIIFLCCLPAVINQICAEIKTHLRKDKLLYSFVAGFATKKLANILGFTNIIKPEFTWTEMSSKLPWNVGTLPVDCLGNKQLMEKFCPLGQVSMQVEGDKEQIVVQPADLPVCTDVSWLMRVVYACVNYATSQQVMSDSVADIVNKIFFQSAKLDTVMKEVVLEEHLQLPSEAVVTQLFDPADSDRSTYLEQTNISMRQSAQASAYFPYWDLTSVGDKNLLAEFLMSNKSLRNAFIRRYCSSFDRVLQF